MWVVQGISGAMRESVEAPTEPVPKGQYQLPDTAAMQSDSYQDEVNNRALIKESRLMGPTRHAKEQSMVAKHAKRVATSKHVPQ